MSSLVSQSVCAARLARTGLNSGPLIALNALRGSIRAPLVNYRYSATPKAVLA